MAGNVRYWHKADVQTAPMNVHFEGNNGHDVGVARCPLMTHGGHLPALRKARHCAGEIRWFLALSPDLRAARVVIDALPSGAHLRP